MLKIKKDLAFLYIATLHEKENSVITAMFMYIEIDDSQFYSITRTFVFNLKYLQPMQRVVF